MITEIFIENYKLDVNASLDAMLTYAIDDIKDFASRNTSFSKTISLPGTARNNAVFGNVFNINQNGAYDSTQANVNFNYNVAKSANCIIFQGNIQVFKGVIRILEIILDNETIEYDCAVFGQLGGLISAMGALKLEDLDFKAYNHTWSIANIVSSWDNASGGSGYYYPLIDYGTYSDDKHDWKYGTFKPALFAKEYIDKIFAAANYTYSCDLFNTTRFKSLIIPQNKKDLYKTTTYLINADNSAVYTLINLNSATSATVTYDTISIANFTQSGGVFTYTSDTPITGAMNLKIYGTPNLKFNTVGTKTWSVTTTIYQNSTVLGTNTSNYSYYYSTTGTYLTLPFFYIYSGNVTVSKNDTIYTVVSINIPSSNGGYSGSFVQIRSNTPFTFIAASNVIAVANFGDTITINNNLPSNILQKDFIASIIKMFNLYIYEDKYNSNMLNITPYVDFFDHNPLNALDWSYKMDRSKPISIKPMSELTSRFYEFRFKDDSDYYNDLYKKRYNLSYGSFIFDTQFEFANQNNNIDLVFSSTPIVGYLSEDKVYSTIFKRTDSNISHSTDGGSFVTSKVEEKTDSNIRLLLAKKITSVSSWNIIDTNLNVLGSYTNYPYAGHFDDPNAPGNDLNFGFPKELFFTIVSGAFNVNQFNVYWLPYMYEIIDQDSRLLTATFRLNEQDINLLDFSKLVYIDGVLFRLNQILDYNAMTRDVCKVELLKVINTKY